MNKNGEIGKRKEMKVLAIAVPVILLIGGGYYWFTLENGEKVQVREGYAKLEYSVSNFTVISVNRSVCAVTIINNGDGTLNLTVTLSACVVNSNFLDIRLRIAVVSDLPYDALPQGVKIKAMEMDNSTTNYDFLTSFNQGINATAWSDDDISPGAWAPHTAYVGFTPSKSRFSAYSAIDMEIHDYRTVPIHTIRIEAELLGFSSHVASIVDVEIDTWNLRGGK